MALPKLISALAVVIATLKATGGAIAGVLVNEPFSYPYGLLVGNVPKPSGQVVDPDSRPGSCAIAAI